MSEYELLWAPQPGPQELLIACPLPLIFYGGARGGGKTDGMLGKLLIEGHRYPGINAVVFREEVTQADDLIERARELYNPSGADYKIQQKQFTFENGSRIRFRGLKNLADAQKFQGQNLTHAVVEEVGNYADPRVVWTIFGALRSSKGIPTQLILTGNPGGPGHWWLKQLIVDKAPKGNQILDLQIEQGSIRGIFIPAKVTDNPKLLENDPNYINNLSLVGSKELVRAWLEGDWNAIEGAYFSGSFTSNNIFSHFQVPNHWPKLVGFDWGYHSPYFTVWGAVCSGKDDQGREVPYKQGAILVYRTLTAKGVNNREIGKQIKLAEEGDENIIQRRADPSIFKEDGAESIAEQIRKGGYNFLRADNTRIAGWNQMRQRFDDEMLLYSDQCKELIEETQMLPVCPRNSEDADTTAKDHGVDATRYMTMSRPYTPDPPEERVSDGQYFMKRLLEKFEKQKLQNRRVGFK